VQLLLDAGANVNAKGRNFGYLLSTAVAQGIHNAVQLLLDAGAYVDTKGGKYGCPLGAAAALGNNDLMQ
jgi:ankyrin repeat protein